MVDNFNHALIDLQRTGDAQRHANVGEAAKRAQEHNQHETSLKPPSLVWDRLYSISRIVVPTIAVIAIPAIVELAVWVAASSG